MAEIHPGAAKFSEAARRAVAEGPLFDVPHRIGVSWTSDGTTCVVMALGAADGVAWDLLLTTGRTATDPLVDLMARNDRGEYADRANLRRDLLGIEA